jgi:glycosyltransferase involved in cell wall biosynthesis
MVAALDKERFEPVVLCYRRSDACDRYREAGAEVRVLEATEREVVTPLPGSVRKATSPLRGHHGLRVVNRVLRRDLPMARHIAAVIREVGPDLVHHNDNPRGDRASILGARLVGLPQVAHVRFMPRYFRPVDRVLVRFVDRFVFVSEAVREHFLDTLGERSVQGEVVYDSFDLARFGSVEPGEAERVRKELGVSPGSALVSSFGRLVAWKGQEVFLRAVAEVARSHHELHALVVGDAAEGPEGRAYVESLHGLARELGLESRLTFTGFRSDVPEVMAASDVIVHSSTQPEPFGRVIVEAMAAGRPVVATAAGGVPEIVEAGSTGLLAAPGDVHGVATAIGELLSNPDRAKAMAERGRDSVRNRFNADRFAEQLHRIYESTLADRRGGRTGTP